MVAQARGHKASPATPGLDPSKGAMGRVASYRSKDGPDQTAIELAKPIGPFAKQIVEKGFLQRPQNMFEPFGWIPPTKISLPGPWGRGRTGPGGRGPSRGKSFEWFKYV